MFSPQELTQLQLTVRITAGVSLCAVVCVLIDLKRTWTTMRKSPSRIILWWTIATAISIPAMLFGRLFVPQSPDEQPNPMCVIQGTFLTFSLLSSILWAGCIALNLLIAVKWKFDVMVLLDTEKTYHMLCWGIPGFSALILCFIPGVYGDSILWCWFADTNGWLRLVFLNVPSLLVIASSLVIYAMVAREISRTFKHSSHAEGNYLEVHRRRVKATNRFALKCSLYLLAFILSHSGEVAVYISNLVSPDLVYAIFEMMAVTVPGSGGFITAAYFATRLLKPPRGSYSTRDSFYSGASKYSSRLGRSVVRPSDDHSGKSMRSVLSDRTYLNESPIGSSSRGSIPHAMPSTPVSFHFNEYRNSAIIPSLPPSVLNLRP